MLTRSNCSQGLGGWWLRLLFAPFALPILEPAGPTMWGMVVWCKLLLVVVSLVVMGMLYDGLTPRHVPIRRSRRPR